MALAYTPGLKRKDFCTIRKVRKLPTGGTVTDKREVSYNTVVATACMPGNIEIVNVASALGVEPVVDEVRDTYSCNISKSMLKTEGKPVRKGEIIAARKVGFGLIKREAACPCDGTIELISDTTGQVMVRTQPITLEITAYIPGRVVETLQNEGVIVETQGSLIQGIFGIGGETHGNLSVLFDSPDDFLTADRIDEKCKGRVLVGGSGTDKSAVRRAIEVGASGIIVGGIAAKDIKDIIGREVGVAVTGREDLGLTLILTEGFGRMRMDSKTFLLLKKHQGKLACINGATQIRAGVIRPEIIIPILDKKTKQQTGAEEIPMEGLRPGLPVRVIQAPHFGSLGHVTKLPVELQKIETESDVRVLEIELENGERILVPRANVELIEE